MGNQGDDVRPWHWWVYLCLVTYIALIGIFAIEELNGRDETLRVLLAEEARLGIEGRQEDEERLQELKALRGLRQSLVALVVSGAVGQSVGPLTLREIQCQLVRLRREQITCPEPLGTTILDQAVHVIATFFLKELSAIAGSGQILAILIITASVGGALITLSLKQVRTESPLRTVLRAMGGGIVCYLAVDGGSIPLSVGDVSRIVNPATASLYGLLAGMFSERVFRLLSDVVDAFLSRLTSISTSTQGNPTANNPQETVARSDGS